jgi:hypothetical protein
MTAVLGETVKPARPLLDQIRPNFPSFAEVGADFAVEISGSRVKARFLRRKGLPTAVNPVFTNPADGRNVVPTNAGTHTAVSIDVALWRISSQN